ncbi:hypothetical protein [Oscillatoria salina]|uniref:hypothetical protein n=1 Tax=Oscillatoria salina TaxID=331517 RepID=UPI0013B892A5|nr:hypothetical protein [Oscillatoria salina]MBZ8183049.1 hypothetical protein [Oscillatoria salina IIICB1]NET91230.1 hypothetical protein [Kamptonema sp. SIO1D9]
MRLKTVELFLALTLAATVVACNQGADTEGGDPGDTAPATEQPEETTAPEATEGGEEVAPAEEGGEGGEGS